MTIEDVRRAVDEIRAVADDEERAHFLEGRLHRAVLRAIANGACQDAEQCAALALTTLEIDFARWYA